MRYLPHTEAEIAEMLEVVSLNSLDELFSSIPKEARLAQPLDIPAGVDEPTLMRHLTMGAPPPNPRRDRRGVLPPARPRCWS